MTSECIMIIDDNPHDNYFASRMIHQVNPDQVIVLMESGGEALQYIAAGTEPRPDVILLDILMPVMSGWDFLTEYCKLDEAIQGRAMIVMLTTSDQPAHIEKSKTWDGITDYIVKPLTSSKWAELSDKYFDLKKRM